jgi:hypothetical protein
MKAGIQELLKSEIGGEGCEALLRWSPSPEKYCIATQVVAAINVKTRRSYDLFKSHTGNFFVEQDSQIHCDS